MPKISSSSPDLHFGHALTTTAPLLAHAPSTLTQNTTWQIPSLQLDTLLRLSTGLALVGELTPVQAWFRISSHAEFKNLSDPAMAALKNELRSLVGCYGFGAVIEEGAFEDCVGRFLPLAAVEGRPSLASGDVPRERVRLTVPVAAAEGGMVVGNGDGTGTGIGMSGHDSTTTETGESAVGGGVFLGQERLPHFLGP